MKLDVNPPLVDPAPALARGIKILRLLGDACSRSLEELARASGWPKSSLLRILETLERAGLVQRDAQTKQYRALYRLAPLGSGGQESGAHIQRVLRGLAEKTGTATEWYDPRSEGLVLVDRAEARNGEVRVRAGVGFVRSWCGELDAVCCIGKAGFPDVTPPPESNGEARFWIYHNSGGKVEIDLIEVERRVQDARDCGYIVDSVYNTNGVRRMACLVFTEQEPIGVLALAENMTPSAHRLGASRLQALLEAAQELDGRRREMKELQAMA